MPRVSRLLTIAICLAVLPTTGWASSPDLFGFGARAIGSAGAVVSHPKGFEAVYHNPAGLSFETHPGVTLGYTFGRSILHHDDSDLDSTDATSTLIGFALPLPFGGGLKKRIALGGGFTIPTNTVLNADLPRPGDPNFAVLANRAQTVTLQAALSVRLSDAFAFGAGFMALSSLEGRIEVGPNAEGRIGSSARDQLVASYAPVIGFLAHLSTNVSLGAVYRGASAATFELPLSANLGEGFSIPIPELAIRGVAQYDPAQIEAEVSWRLGDARVALGVNWNRWSQFPQPIVYAAAPADHPALPSPNFSDAMEYGIGYEQAVNSALTVRAGYRYLQTPVPTAQSVHAHLGSDRHLLAIGAQLSWSRVHLGVAAQAHLLESAQLKRTDHAPTEHGGKLWVLAVEIGVTL